jgi:FAD-linked sulfhydryl oxidase
MFFGRGIGRSAAVAGAMVVSLSAQKVSLMDGKDPFDCADPVCKSKIDIFRSAMSRSSAASAVPKVPEVAERVGECPVDKDELGRGTWALLHTMAAYYPDKPSSQQKIYAELLFRGLAALYPCKICATHMQECVRDKPPETESRESLSLWVCDLHNKVNEVLGKDVYPCKLKDLDTRWRTGSSACWDEGAEDPSTQEKL